MAWLILLGLTFDGIGAFLIALPILRPGSAAREVSRPRWGGNKWEPVQRLREQRLVQYGALFLVAGFAVQAVAYLERFNVWWLAVLAIATVGALGLWVGTRLASTGLPRHVWYGELKPADALADQRHMLGVSTIDDWRKLFELWFAHKFGKPSEPIEQRGAACVENGMWTAYCPRCHQPAIAWPANPEVICDNCRARFIVDFPAPEMQERIERALVRQRDPEQRRWAAGDPDEGYPPDFTST